MLIRMKTTKKVGLLVLDSVTSLILGSSSQRIALGEWLSSLRELGWNIIVTNLVQGRL